MPQIVATFEKVSYEQFVKDFKKNIEYMNIDPSIDGDNLESLIRETYDSIKLPKRSTTKSAGYDFYSPRPYNIFSGCSVVIPTGIRCRIDDSWYLGVYPRSGLGFKYKVGLDNTVGIIDADYYDADNEGHIMIKIHHGLVDDSLSIPDGSAFAQGIFMEYGITTDDAAEGVRTGGFGSTDNT